MKVKYYNSSFKLDTLPLDAIHVIDDWCSPGLWQRFNNALSVTDRWSFDNDVTYADGETTEITWIMRLFKKWMKPAGNYVEFSRPVIEQMCSDFGVEFEQFDFAGINGQTQGLQGTIHVDSFRAKNISFLWHCNTEWQSEWGGSFRVYQKDTLDKGHRGFSQELVDNYQIAEIKYKPNRLIIIDGSYPHSADAPTPESKYAFRKTFVARGNVAKLVDKNQ
tara:strand:+ start:1996 stop:2655 length:660 start_codon:yes stop_codon:yes gene_type:complete